MAEKKIFMCPVFEDVPCPRGEEAAEACSVRMNGDFDPMADFKDLLLMHCALYRAEQKRDTKKESGTTEE